MGSAIRATVICFGLERKERDQAGEVGGVAGRRWAGAPPAEARLWMGVVAARRSCTSETSGWRKNDERSREAPRPAVRWCSVPDELVPERPGLGCSGRPP